MSRAYLGFFFFLLAFFFLTACSNKTSNNTEIISEFNDLDPNRERIYMVVTINNTRIRNTPDLAGEQLGRLDAKDLVEYMHDSTRFTTTIKLNGKTYQKGWYKVLSDLGIEGWVYGACLEFLSDAENDRIVALRKDEEVKGGGAIGFQNTKKVQHAPKLDQNLLKNYQNYLLQIAVSDANAVARAADYFEMIFVRNNDPNTEYAFADFMRFHKKVLTYWASNLNISKYQYLAPDIKNYKSTNMLIEPTTQVLAANGLGFGLDINGKIYLRQDIDFVLKRFYRLVNNATREYLNQIQLEQDYPALSNGQIYSSVQNLATYAVFWDKFLIKYSHFAFSTEIAVYRHQYLEVLLKGTTEKPAFNVGSDVLEEPFKEAYVVVTEKMGHSPLIAAFQKYFDLLTERDFEIDKTIRQAQEELLARY